MPEPLGFDDLVRFHREVLLPEISGLGADLHAAIADARTDLHTEIVATRTDLTAEIAAVRTDLTAEIADLRIEIAAVRTDLHAEIAAVRTDLTVEIATTRTDFARHLTSKTDALRGDLRSFRGEMDDFRRDVFSHFDAIYQRLDSEASEHQALKAAVGRLETAGAGHGAELAAIRYDLGGLRAEVMGLSGRITALERLPDF